MPYDERGNFYRVLDTLPGWAKRKQREIDQREAMKKKGPHTYGEIAMSHETSTNAERRDLREEPSDYQPKYRKVILHEDGRIKEIIERGTMGPRGLYERAMQAEKAGEFFDVGSLNWWQDALLQAWESSRKIDMLGIWAGAHGIEITSANASVAYELYLRDPKVKLILDYTDDWKAKNY